MSIICFRISAAALSLTVGFGAPCFADEAAPSARQQDNEAKSSDIEQHLKNGNTPTIRIEQDGTAGFSEQIWDIAGNETNFFIRDVTNGNILPFRVMLGAPNDALVLAKNGDIAITGSLISDETKLDVSDNVFEPTYDLLPLANLEEFILLNGHLPAVPSQGEINSSGLNVTSMQMTLLKKVEELTLYTLEQQRLIEKLREELNAVKSR